jgi:hypothetical protein
MQIAALVLALAAGYAAYSYKVRAIITAASSLVRAIQAIRAARADGRITDAERLRIADAALVFEADIGTCTALIRR